MTLVLTIDQINRSNHAMNIGKAHTRLNVEVQKLTSSIASTDWTDYEQQGGCLFNVYALLILRKFTN